MAPGSIDPEHFSPDLCDFLALIAKHQVRYLIVGGEAVIYYGHARLTGDLDIFVHSIRTISNVCTPAWMISGQAIFQVSAARKILSKV